MSQAKLGDTVLIHYTGKLADGTVFETSVGREPLQMTLGESRVIPGFEATVLGMSPGETTSTTLAAQDAFGPHKQDLVVQFSRDRMPPDIDPQVGHRMELETETGQSIEARIVEVSPEIITVDANHPLAGKDVMLDLELVEIVGKE